jgi:hypothetical protein
LKGGEILGAFSEKKVFKNEKGTVLEMRIKADCATSEEMRETISFIAQSARKFYLHIAEKINNMP